MVAVTPVMHNFWDEKENSQGRLNETINFFKVCPDLDMVNAELRPNLQPANNPVLHKGFTWLGIHAECSNSWSALVLYWRQATTSQAASGVMEEFNSTTMRKSASCHTQLAILYTLLTSHNYCPAGRRQRLILCSN